MSQPTDWNSSSLFAAIGARLTLVTIQYRVPPWERDDCTQEARLALQEEHPDWLLDEPRTPAFLLKVTRNEAVDSHRRRQRHPSLRIEDLSPTLSGFTTTDDNHNWTPNDRRTSCVPFAGKAGGPGGLRGCPERHFEPPTGAAWH